MRWYRGPEGDERLWVEMSELEMAMEEQLRDANLLPSVDAPVVDVESFLERHLMVELDQYAPLPAEILGLTEFRATQSPRVLINKDLTGSAMDADWVPPGSPGRWRATLAHEAVHVILHRALFEFNVHQGLLFEERKTSSHKGQMLRCLKREVQFTARSADWKEVQANRGMAALLMPRSVFMSIAKQEIFRHGVAIGRLREGSEAEGTIARRLAERFGVSRQAASIRLQTLGFTEKPGALSLYP